MTERDHVVYRSHGHDATGGACETTSPSRGAHVSHRGDAPGEPVTQVHDGVGCRYRRFEEGEVRGHRTTVEHLVPDAEHDRVHPEVKTVAEFLAQEGLHQVQAPDDLHVLVPVPDLAWVDRRTMADSSLRFDLGPA